MIPQFNDYNETKAYSDYQTLPVGGYVMKILGAEIKSNSQGQYVQISCDVADGEYAGFYAADYKSQNKDKKWRCNYLLNIPKNDGTEKDGWTKRRFKTFTEALEQSNNGYHFDWDEQKFKGKFFGGLFNQREYRKRDGSGTAWATNLAQVTTVQRIHDGDFKIPADKPLNDPPPAYNDGFMDASDAIDEELPFA